MYQIIVCPKGSFITESVGMVNVLMPYRTTEMGENWPQKVSPERKTTAI